MTTAAIHLGLYGPTEMMMSAMTAPATSKGLLGLVLRRMGHARAVTENPRAPSPRQQALELQAFRNASSWA